MIRAFSFGASTAQGARDTEGGFIVRIGKRLEQDGRGSAENFGIGGHTTDDMIPRLPGLAINDPSDIAIVTLGINDVPRTPDKAPDRRVPLDRHDANVHKILEDLKERCRVLYITQYPVTYVDRGLDQALVESYVNVGRQVAHEVGVTGEVQADGRQVVGRLVPPRDLITGALRRRAEDEQLVGLQEAGERGQGVVGRGFALEGTWQLTHDRAPGGGGIEHAGGRDGRLAVADSLGAVASLRVATVEAVSRPYHRLRQSPHVRFSKLARRAGDGRLGGSVCAAPAALDPRSYRGDDHAHA